MSLAVNVLAFSSEIKHDPQLEEAGKIVINVNISGVVDNSTFTTTSFIEEFIEQGNYDDCQSKQDLDYFLIQARLNEDQIRDAMLTLFYVVGEDTYYLSSEGLQRISLEVGIDIRLSEPNDSHIEEAVQASFNETNNIQFRPVSKLVVKSLTKKVYYKSSSLDGDKCTICLEEFNNGISTVVTFPCGHEFDDECLGKWFETSHACPLCRFELPCED